MNILFFLASRDWNARARIFTAAAHGLADRGHAVTIACPPGAIIDRIDAKRIGIVRTDPAAFSAIGTFDLRRVAQERSIDVAFVSSAREQLMVGSGLRLGGGGALVRRLGLFESRSDEPGVFAGRVTPARIMVSTNGEASTIVTSGAQAPLVAPLGVSLDVADAIEPRHRHDLHLRDDAMVVSVPFEPNGRVRLLNIMRTLALIAPRHPRLRAVVHGQGATDDDLRMQAAALGVAPLMHFLDGNAVEPVAVMKTADFVWLACDHDGAGMACLDAMSAGRAVIAERSRSVDYFVADGITGSVLPDGDPATIAAAVAHVISRSDARSILGTAGRNRAQREFGLDAMVNGYERAAESAGPRPQARR